MPLFVNSIFPFAPSNKVRFPAFVPELVSIIKSCAPLVVISPFADPEPTTTSPVPLGFKVIFPLAASVIVIADELVPALVSRVKSNAPLEVRTPVVAPSPTVRAVEVRGPNLPVHRPSLYHWNR